MQPPVAAGTNVVQIRDPIADIYRSYDPGFRFPEQMSDETKRLSSEPHFYTLNLVPESARANALVEAGRKKEEENQFKEAMDVYQKVIDEYSDMLYRVNDYGVFIAITEYCQSRILNFPPEPLALYRTKFDSRAREAYELARQRNSLEGLAQVRDSTLATTYGAEALKTLGFSALDKGHYLEALEYFERVWDLFPEARTANPSLPMSIALCRKMLGQANREGPQYGLVGHWKMDEGSGNTTADASGCGNVGSIGFPPSWAQGKIGGALHFDWSNTVSVAASKQMNIGVGGADFSVAFWLKWESGSYPNVVFAKRGRGPEEMLCLEITRGNQIHYTLATLSPQWETGNTKGAVASKRPARLPTKCAARRRRSAQGIGVHGRQVRARQRFKADELDVGRQIARFDRFGAQEVGRQILLVVVTEDRHGDRLGADALLCQQCADQVRAG